MGPASDLPELSEDVQLEYLAEGGANIVYRILIPFAAAAEALQPSEIEYYGNATPPPTEIEELDLMTDDVGADAGMAMAMDMDMNNITSGKLLRLRKNVPFGLPYRSTAEAFHSKIRPLFAPDELVDQFLVRVPPILVQRCNQKLRDSERIPGNRPLMRHGVYLATDEPLGMLITDMTNTNNPTDAVFTVAELKPKWLVQSPSAPPASKRCRTCALRDMKAADANDAEGGANRENTHNQPGKAPFCPLDLMISDNEQDMQRTLTKIFAHRLRHHHHHHGPSPSHIRLMARALHQHPTLLKLLSLQRLHNDVGLHGPGPGSGDMSLSMTLRDCSIFFKIHHPETSSAEITDIRIGDLDLKSAANGKAEYWLSIENRLINEGWYMGQQPSQIETEGECVLSR